MISIPANPKELLGKTTMVVRYFVFHKGFVSKFRMHRAVLRTLSPFRRQKLIFFRTTLMYILPYLSKSFGVSRKQSILIDHYSFLDKKFSLSQLRQLFSDDGLEAYTETKGSDIYSVRLKSVTNHLEFEGSMSVLFKLNDIILYSLCFTFIKGEVFGINEEWLIYVSALQGTKNEYENIRISTKYFKENSLPVILLKTVEAIAVPLGIRHCVGISAHSQLSLKYSGQFERFFNNYDAFWLNNGAERIKDDYLLKFPLIQKPIEQIAQAHRNRTLKKRQKMQELSASITDAFVLFLKNGLPFSAEDIDVSTDD
jgi:uncharacterized protein VirK/YbjX